MNTTTWLHRTCLGLGALSICALLAAPAVLADPGEPGDPALPTVVAADAGAPAPSSADPAVAPAPAPVPVQHLSSPDNPPPGTTTTDIGAPPQGRLGYLRDLLHAMRTQEVSGSDALLLLTQRPLDANAAPPPGVPVGPSGPVGTSAAPPAADPVVAN